ncbi:Cytochrome oxidase assembly factor 4 [Wickerhamiella sorbophila]|uniref:Cytochrome oxidase assembly factor 4 n=1 Tax=Wickerhamiella sorbophila TaxID=45607 RepID=A0A2T0FPR3_9ASCO|nr:Cytochrome oxidase assembly factor 4 [Wickerhamiella sorbophila]PRT56965.1 Cytochrome oxidase assembly factor 4 [Wickerhamiella sorbophila]
MAINMDEDPDEWDVRIINTGCAAENEALQLCHADTGDWRKCLPLMKAFRECWARYNNDERTSTVQAPQTSGNEVNLTK